MRSDNDNPVFLSAVFLLILTTTTIAHAERPKNASILDAGEALQLAVKEARDLYQSTLLQGAINGTQSSAQSGRNCAKCVQEHGVKVEEVYRVYQSALSILVNKYNISRSSATPLILSARESECPILDTIISLACNPAEKYRRINGTCNNLRNPAWGSTFSPLERVINALYTGENADEPRGGLAISTLPPPREISRKIHLGGNDNYDDSATHIVAQFGQFLDHDITLTAEGGKVCCPASNDPDCWSLQIPEDDPFYSGKTTCLSFTRSTPTCLNTPDRNREQMNLITAFIDASTVYGSDDRLTKMLRKFAGGELEENSEIRGGLIPFKKDVDPNSEERVVLAGDRRASEMPGLVVMHTLFAKEHNRIAHSLASITDWEDEQLFQEARRILQAEMQQIVYSQYLPAILGPEAMTKYGLTLQDRSQYNATQNPNIMNAFATAAYRFGHTLVNGLVQLYMGESVRDSYLVRNNYFALDMIIDQASATMPGYDQILKGLTKQTIQKSDATISEDMTNFLFFQAVEQHGSDLAARNIQRGRDHGVPGYNAYRQYCGLSPLTSWEPTAKPAEINLQAWEKLRDAYGTGSVDDIDLYTGGLSETVVNEGQAGPTFVCLMGQQFHALKYGDRFFFTHANQAGSFTFPQLADLLKRTLSDIICENSGIEAVQMNAFQPVSTQNPLVPCNSATRQRLNLTLYYDSSSEPSSTPNSSSKPVMFDLLLLLPVSLVVILICRFKN